MTEAGGMRPIIEARIAVDGVGTIGGVSVADDHVWFACSAGDLVCLDRRTHAVVRRLDGLSPTAGTAFDGTNLWQIEAERIVCVDPDRGVVLRSIPRPEGVACSGMAWAEGALWVGDHGGRRILKIDPDSGEVLRAIDSDRFVTGVAFDRGKLLHGAWEACEGPKRPSLREVDPTDGTVQRELELPSELSLTGVARDNKGRYWCGGGESGEILVVRVSHP